MCHAALSIEPRLISAGRKFKSAPPTRQICATVRAETYEALRAHAEALGVPVGAVIRGALERAVV